MARVDRQGALDQGDRLRVVGGALGGGHGVGVVGEERRALRLQLGGAAVRRDRVGVAAEHGVGARQHDPALDVVRPFLHAGGELVDHRRDLFLRLGRGGRVAGRCIRGAGGGVIGRHRPAAAGDERWRAGRQVAGDGDDADRGGQARDQPPRRPRPRRRRRLRRGGGRRSPARWRAARRHRWRRRGGRRRAATSAAAGGRARRPGSRRCCSWAAVAAARSTAEGGAAGSAPSAT